MLHVCLRAACCPPAVVAAPTTDDDHRRAKDLIQSNIDILHRTAAVLMEKENIDGDEFQQIIMESQASQYLKADAPGVTIPYQTA